MFGPNPNAVHPNENIPSVCYIKNTITRPNIIVGKYTYYDDPENSEDFERHVTHHYEFIGDKLIIGKFCAIAKGVEFIMNGANHRMNNISTYPFNIMGSGWEKESVYDKSCESYSQVKKDAKEYRIAGAQTRITNTRWLNAS